jgi:hypothetical protein
MKTLSALLFTCFAFLQVNAQSTDWQIFRPDFEHIYASETNTNYYSYYGIRPISVSIIGNDEIIELNKNVLSSGGSRCFNNNSSIIGKTIVNLNNGTSRTTTFKDDTLILKFQVGVGERWVMYKGVDYEVHAEVISQKLTSYLNVFDSIKTITFQAYDLNQNPINHEFNSALLTISKHDGMISGPGLGLFPNVQFFEIKGLKHKQVGLQNLTWVDAFDINPGDEIHYIEYYNGGSADNKRKETKTIDKYLLRVSATDSIVFQINRIQTTKEWESNVEVRNDYFNDTIVQIERKPKGFNNLPGELEELSTGFYSSNYLEGDNKILGFDLFEKRTDSCLDYVLYDPVCSRYYIKGLGGTYFNCQGYDFITDSRSLIYYKKGNTTWGTPLVLTSIKQTQKLYGLELFPNPSNKIVNVKGLEPNTSYQVRILNVNGKEMIFKANYNGGNIEISDLPNGLYMMNISKANGDFTVLKLIVQD